MADDSPDTKTPFLHVGPNNHGPAVVVSAYVLVMISILTTLIRLGGIFRKKRRLSIADGFIIIASLLGLVETVTINLATNHGLGKHLNDVSPSDQGSYYKVSYAAQLLAIAIMTCAKLSVVQLVRSLDPHSNVKSRLTFLGTVCIWAVFAIFASAFQCGLPGPWIYTPEKCLNGGLIYAVDALNVLTDGYLAIFFVPTVWRLKAELSTRITVMLLFLSRLLTSATGVAKMVVESYSLPNDDQTWSQTGVVVTGQLLLNLSIITANLPGLRGFLYDLQTGQSGVRLGERQAEDLELSVVGFTGPSKDETFWSGGSAGADAKQVSQHSQVEHVDKKPEECSDRGSEEGILRVVDISLHYERPSG